jgi:microcystin-dependent protein
MRKAGFTSVLIIALSVAVSVASVLLTLELVEARPAVSPDLPSVAPTVVSYQGRVTLGSSPYDGLGFFKFAIVDGGGATTYWSNDGTSIAGGEPTNGTPVPVSRGLLNVLLGDPALTNMTLPLDASVFSGTERYLRVWFSTDNISFQPLSPDRRIAAVPYALQAQEAVEAENADTVDGQHASDLVPPGTVVAYAGDSPPPGWLLCDGSAVSRTTYAALFAALGTAHGEGNGETTFNLPDYRGTFLRGVDMGAGRDPDAASRAAPGPGGNSGDAVGSVQDDQMQSHRHRDSGHQHTYRSQQHDDYRTVADGSGETVADNEWQNYYSYVSYANLGDPYPSTAGSVRHGLETRPKNANVMWIIRH